MENVTGNRYFNLHYCGRAFVLNANGLLQSIALSVVIYIHSTVTDPLGLGKDTGKKKMGKCRMKPSKFVVHVSYNGTQETVN